MIDEARMSDWVLSLAEKISILSSRYRDQGMVFAQVLGINPVTLSRVANAQVSASPTLRQKICENSFGWVTLKDFDAGPQPKARGRKPAIRPEDDGLDL